MHYKIQFAFILTVTTTWITVLDLTRRTSEMPNHSLDDDISSYVKAGGLQTKSLTSKASVPYNTSQDSFYTS